MQDIILCGFPGTDHGELRHKCREKLLKKEGKTKYDLGREKFVEKMWQWREETGIHS
jgi:valyl-tRNA synthetase